MSLFAELKRRNVFRVAVAYIVIGWLIVQVIETLLPMFGVPDAFLRGVVLLLVIGFLPVLLFSWAYEITPEGIRRESEVERTESITHLTARKLDTITLVALAGVAALVAWQQLGPGRDRPAAPAQTALPAPGAAGGPAGAPNAIAVLPFAHRSALQDDRFFTDGIHDDLLTQLAKMRDLKVISRTSVMQYRDTAKPLPEIARELGVSKILEGGVQRAGQRIRINAQLIDVDSDEHLWAETYDREMTVENLFDIQSEITAHIVNRIRGELRPEERRALLPAPTASIPAYEAYLQAREHIRTAGYRPDKFLTAQRFLERALALDPDFAEAHLLLGTVHGYVVWTGYDLSPTRRTAARASLDRARELLGETPEWLAAQGQYLYRFDRDFEAALEVQRRALAGRPGDAGILEDIGVTQRRLGQFDEAIAHLLRAAELDPGSAQTAAVTAETIYHVRRWGVLREFVDAARRRFPHDNHIGSIHAWLPLLTDGDVATTRARMDALVPDTTEWYVWLTIELPWLERDFERVLATWKRPEILQFTSIEGFKGTREINLAAAYLHLGQRDEAMRLLDDIIALLEQMDRDRPAEQVASELGTLATAYALRGNPAEAIARAEEATALYPIEKDRVSGTFFVETLAYVLALAGETDRALDLIAELLDAPNGFMRWEVFLDARWDPLREDPRFDELVRPPGIAM